MLMGCLATYANFTMLNVIVCVYAIFMGMNLYEIWKFKSQKKKNIIVSSVILILFFALIIIPIIHLKNKGNLNGEEQITFFIVLFLMFYKMIFMII